MKLFETPLFDYDEFDPFDVVTASADEDSRGGEDFTTPPHVFDY